VLIWEGTLSRSAALAIDPAFASHGVQLVPEWNANSLVLQAVPETCTLALLAAEAIGILAYGLRRR
jgi:hypothetical protein